VASECACPVLAIFGGADKGIPPEAIATYGRALTDADVDHRIVTYEDAPHSFFDRKQEDYSAESAAAWEEVLSFVRTNAAAAGG